MLKQSVGLDKQLTEFDKPIIISTYFGFQPIRPPKITEKDSELVKNWIDHPHYNAVEKVALLRTYIEENLSSLPHPLAIVYKKPVSRRKFGSHALHLIGSASGIAEATLIRAALSILSEEGHKNLRVDVNCIGDRESIAAYEKELTNFVKRANAPLTDEFRQSIKDDVFNLFRSDAPEARELCSNAPSSITFLSAQSRLYFKEVLEYIESLGIEFRLAPDLVGERNHSSHTIFAIKDSESETETLAVGYRYSRLARLFGLRKEIPMVGVSIFSKNGMDSTSKRLYKELPKPKFYLVQLGQQAKIKTLSLIEMLRNERIPVHHLIGRDKITQQLTSAESLRVSYLIIIGQKEAIDNTATIRNVATRAQDTINMTDLPHYLKNIRL